MSRFLGMLAAALVLAGCGLIADDDERYSMATDAMAPTVKRDQRVTVRLGDEPHRGEIVVFRPPAGWASGDGKVSIARVIGIGNDELACCDVAGAVVLNSEPLDEPYLGTNSPLEAPVGTDCRGRRFAPVKVPPGELFLMGDNRLVSRDSRCAGTVPADAVIGVVAETSTSRVTLPG